LQQALERDGWDGDWYRRAYFDDGTPLGSAQNDECRIDSIAQSWAVISGAADPAHAARAMAEVDKCLVRRDDGLVLLFTPPFDKTTLEPGYIKGYPPGIRENGGQYTHAAIWSVIAFAMLGDGDKAGELFALMNPINHAGDDEAARRYAVEPYVVAADVYSEPPHVGRGGWTWYTGSAGMDVPGRNRVDPRLSRFSFAPTAGESNMKTWKCAVLCAISALAMSACARQESVADAQKQADAAAVKGSERVMDAKRDAVNAEIKADAAVEKSEDKAAAQMDRAQADALQKTANAEVRVSLAQAQQNYNVTVAKCRALSGADRDNCKAQAQADLDAAKAQASATREDVKAETDELKR
jgi:hypothetical protein